MDHPVHEALKSPMDLPEEFKGWLVKYLEVHPPSLPAAQMPGYRPLDADIVSVKAAGVKGDGATDDTRKIQAVIDKVAADGGGVVYFPAGTYMLTTYLTVGSNVTLLGQGRETVLKLRSDYTSGASGQGFIFATGKSDIAIDGLSFDGQKGTVSPDPVNNFAVYVVNSSRVTMRNCYVTNLNGFGSGVNSAFCGIGTSHWCDVSHNRFFSCDGGAAFFQGGDCAAFGNNLSSCGDVGIVWNTTAATHGVAMGNRVGALHNQCAFGVENGASEFTIVGNEVAGCFGALDLNDAGYAGAQNPGGIFANNIVYDSDKGSSAQSASVGVFVRTSRMRDIKILDNVFSGLTVYGAVDSFVLVTGSTEGLEIRGNTFEGKAQALPACILFSGANTRARLVIEDNTFRSTSSVTKLSRGIWLGAGSTYTNALVANNRFENITNYGVQWDAGVSWSGALRDNWVLSGVGALYQASPWGTWSNVVRPHVFDNATFGRTRISHTGIPGTGTWQQGDVVLNYAVAAGGAPGWVCVVGGSPGTWKALDDDEIGYDEITASVSVTGTSSGAATTVIAGSAYTFDGRPVVLEFFTPQAITPNAAAGNFIAIGLYEGGSLVSILATLTTPAAAFLKAPIMVRQRFTPSAGPHTYTIKAWVATTTGAPQIIAGTGSGVGQAPCYLRFTKI